jgi:hypothetical protein
VTASEFVTTFRCLEKRPVKNGLLLQVFEPKGDFTVEDQPKGEVEKLGDKA